MIDALALLLSAQLLAAQLSSLGYVIVGTILCIIGVMLIVVTIEIPIVNIITSAIGWSLIVIGGAVGLYGVSPTMASMTYLFAFLIIWLVGLAIIVWHEITALRK